MGCENTCGTSNCISTTIGCEMGEYTNEESAYFDHNKWFFISVRTK